VNYRTIGFFIAMILAGVSNANSAEGKVSIHYRMTPIFNSVSMEMGTILLTLQNNQSTNLPADTIEIAPDMNVQIETRFIPFDTLAAGASISMVLPYRRLLGSSGSVHSLSASYSQGQLETFLCN